MDAAHNLRVNTMNETTTNLQACLLIYDIPERSSVRNPSRRLRSFAVRVNLSFRVIRGGDTPCPPLSR